MYSLCSVDIWVKCLCITFDLICICCAKKYNTTQSLCLGHVWKPFKIKKKLVADV